MKLITLAQAADQLGVSIRTVRRRIATGDLPAYRLNGGRSIRIDADQLTASTLHRVPTAAPYGGGAGR